MQLDRESLLAIGVFDGVHAGHRHLIEDLTDRASSTGKLAGVVTSVSYTHLTLPTILLV